MCGITLIINDVTLLDGELCVRQVEEDPETAGPDAADTTSVSSVAQVITLDIETHRREPQLLYSVDYCRCTYVHT